MLTAASSLALGSSAKLRIAIMGTGLAGSTVASVLAQKADVTIFEAGRAPGGRSSTRRSREVSYVFDHGLQYISRPKSREFTEVLDEWLACGCVARWEPRTAIVDLPIQSSPQVFEDAEKGVGFVGNPSSDSIVKFQLEKAEGVKTKFNCRTNAHFLEESQTWKLVSDTTGEDLGEFDWLVTGARLSAAPWRKDFASDSATQNATAEFRALAGTVSSDPCLVIMVAFDRHVAFPGVNSLLFKNSPKLAWAARDSSKPGRGRQDDHECWVRIRATLLFFSMDMRSPLFLTSLLIS